ncbi:TPA: hypothetical protein DCY67_01850 [Candidatus Acetothermia bacterium]|nr:hypothetical protein [Candidatus Acetothermia bacterium]
MDAARILLQQGYHDFAASRSYCPVFYAAEAALLRKGLAFSKYGVGEEKELIPGVSSTEQSHRSAWTVAVPEDSPRMKRAGGGGISDRAVPHGTADSTSHTPATPPSYQLHHESQVRW